MKIRRTSHAVCDTRYHLVWAPKYRKWILRGDIRKYVEECFEEIAISNEFEIEAMEIAEDHVLISLGFPPRYSISEVVRRFKGKTAREVFQRYPEAEKEFWGGEFGEDGYSVRTVGDEITKDTIRKYIQYHQRHKKFPPQLKLF